MNIKKCYKTVLEYMYMTFGAVLYAVGISIFLDPNHLAPGGITGIGIILHNFIPLQTGTIVFLFNIPLIILGFLKLGRKLIIRTFYCIALTSALMDSINSLYGQALTEDKIISALTGASLVSIGIGIIMKKGGTTGGSDIIIRLLRKRFPHMKTSMLFLIFDLSVVTLSAVAFRDVVVALYAMVAVVTGAFVLDKVLYGTDEAKMIYIISDHSGLIADRLLKELGVGITFIQGEGAYSGKEKKVILAVMRKLVAPKAEEIIKEADPQVFMIVTGANEIYGKGYKDIFGEKL